MAQLVVDSTSVAKVRQLTGDLDRHKREPVSNRTQTRFGVAGTDLGSSFEHKGRLWFLFGDTAPVPIVTCGGVTALSRVSEHMELFGMGADGEVHHSWAWDGVWRPWKPFGDLQTDPQSGLASVSRTAEHMEVFGVGPDQKAVGRWFWADRWSDWYSHRGPDLDPGAGLAALSRQPEHMELYAIGTDGIVYGTWFWYDHWHDWFSLGAPAGHRFAFNGRLAAVSREPRHMEVFGVTTDGGLWSRWWWDGTWHDWARLDDGTLSLHPRVGVTAVSRSPEHMEVFVVDGGGTVHGRWFWNGWQSWFALPRVNLRPLDRIDLNDKTSGVAAVSCKDTHMGLFVTAQSGRVWEQAWNSDNGWAGGWHPREDCSDSIAWTQAETALPATFELEFLNDGGRWGDFRATRLIDVDGTVLSSGCLEVPVEGCSLHGQIYVFHSTNTMGRTMLARAMGEDPTDLRVLYQLSDHTGCTPLDQPCANLSLGRFINVSGVVVPAGHPHSPFGGATMFVWGSGHYRHSPVYLAAVPSDSIADRGAWRYWTAVGAWSTDERAAIPVVNHLVVGELNVTWNEPLGHWLLLYNVDSPATVVGRIAPTPWGRWSEASVIFNLQTGLGVFVHRGDSDDHLEDPGRPEGGGCYGPYVIDRFTRPAGPSAAEIWFLMSTWNPYQAILMTATLHAE